MKITLRKASELQNRIQQELKTIQLTPRVNLSEFADPAEDIAKANADMMKAMDSKMNLLQALFEIRELLGAANYSQGISKRLTELALIDKVIGVYGEVNHQGYLSEKMQVLTGKLRKMKSAEVSGDYGYRPAEIATGVLTVDNLADMSKKTAELRKRKVKLNDEILELNIKNEITLSPAVVTILQTMDIL